MRKAFDHLTAWVSHSLMTKGVGLLLLLSLDLLFWLRNSIKGVHCISSYLWVFPFLNFRGM